MKRKATFLRVVAGTDVDPALAESPPPNRKRGRPVQAIEPAPDKPLSITAENGHIRQERYEVWRMAETATRYWRMRMDFHSAVQSAQSHEIPEGRFHPVVNQDDWMPMVEKWRAAFVSQLLTPAPTTAAVKWKQMALVGHRLTYTDAKPERIERAIADDLAFLAAHPVRQSKQSNG